MKIRNILQIVQSLSDEKNLETDVIYKAVELALAAAVKKEHELDIEAKVLINRDSGDVDIYRCWEVVEDDDEFELEFPDRQIALSEARKKEPEAEVGQMIEKLLPSTNIGRISAQAARQVVMQKVREAERQRVLDVFGPREGEMIFGIVRRVDRGDAFVDVEGVEALLPRTNCIPKDGLRQGDRIRAILKEVKTDSRGPQLILDRVANELLIEMFKLEVPETREGLVEIRSAARDPGLRAKIAVYSSDPKTDPIGACVGVRGARVHTVSNEINGERIDIVEWSANISQYAVNALAPANVEKVQQDPVLRCLNVQVMESQLSQAIGSKGQNVRLASQLTGWDLNILTEEEYDEKMATDAAMFRDKLMEELNVDETIAEILVDADLKELLDVHIEGRDILSKHFDADIVDQIMTRAAHKLLQNEYAQEVKFSTPPDASLMGVQGMDRSTAWYLAANAVVTMEDLADYSTFELMDLNIPGLNQERAAALIMSARQPLFDNMDSDPS